MAALPALQLTSFYLQFRDLASLGLVTCLTLATHRSTQPHATHSHFPPTGARDSRTARATRLELSQKIRQSTLTPRRRRALATFALAAQEPWRAFPTGATCPHTPVPQHPCTRTSCVRHRAFTAARHRDGDRCRSHKKIIFFFCRVHAARKSRHTGGRSCPQRLRPSCRSTHAAHGSGTQRTHSPLSPRCAQRAATQHAPTHIALCTRCVCTSQTIRGTRCSMREKL